MPKDPNEVGAAWKKTSERGSEYLSVSLDVDRLMELTGGAVGKVPLTLFPITYEKTNPKAPDFRLMFYDRSGTARPRPAPQPPPLDDDIPF